MSDDSEKSPKGNDIFDRGRRAKQTFSRKEKAEYAAHMHLMSLCEPPKDPSKLPAFLNNPDLLPKRPPGKP